MPVPVAVGRARMKKALKYVGARSTVEQGQVSFGAGQLSLPKWARQGTGGGRGGGGGSQPVLRAPHDVILLNSASVSLSCPGPVLARQLGRGGGDEFAAGWIGSSNAERPAGRGAFTTWPASKIR